MRADTTTDSVRRVMALTKAFLTGDSEGYNVLRPAASPALEHLWRVDPLSAAAVFAQEKDTQNLIDAFLALVALVADANQMERDQLVAALEVWLAPEPPDG